ncbi:MAG: hypothetical protein J2P53_14965, partial [Bradyrhizobiaceae bacterium]|nr:hypothetical protein [Bradyrhizobiaceae bacterium]
MYPVGTDIDPAMVLENSLGLNKLCRANPFACCAVRRSTSSDEAHGYPDDDPERRLTPAASDRANSMTRAIRVERGVRNSPESTLMRTRIVLSICLSILPAIDGGPAAAGTIPQTERPTVAPIVRAVTPGVVNIATKKIETLDNPLLKDPVFRQMFDIPDRALRREVQSAGSGVIVDAKRGYIL